MNEFILFSSRLFVTLPPVMTKRYFIFLGFDGSAYHGWQVQPNGNSVQAEVERALSILLRRPIGVVGAGRTDAGVHARDMAAHFDTDVEVDCVQLAYKLNRLLPADISVKQVVEVPPDMHARFSATSRTYHYYIHTRKDPFVRQHSCFIHYQLNFDLMNEAGRMLTEFKDFGAFCKTHTDVKTTICDLYKAEWERIDDHHYRFVIMANRFLRNMVRAVVGTLVDVGRQRITLDEFRKIVESGKRMEAGESMPAHALFLENVDYPFCDR